MTIGTGDLFSGLSILLLVLVIGGLIVAFSIARARKHGSTTLALDVTRNASYGWVILMGLGAVFISARTFLSDGVDLDDVVYSQVRWDEDSLLAPACITSPGDDATGFACGSSIEGVPLGPRLLILLGTLLGVLASAAIAWAIHTATHRAGERQPFHRSVSRTFGAVAVVVMVASVAGEIIQRIGMTLAAQSLKWEPHVEVLFQLSIPLWPFAVGVGLFALSAIFRYGAQLQRETEGLV